jgi:hypothetical protein
LGKKFRKGSTENNQFLKLHHQDAGLHKAVDIENGVSSLSELTISWWGKTLELFEHVPKNQKNHP